MRIAMIGTGYVGLVSGACFSEFGVPVVCVDQDAGKIARLERGEMPIFEPGLEQLVATNRSAGRLSFTTDLRAAMKGADAVFIAAGPRRAAATAMPTFRISSPPPRRSAGPWPRMA